MPKKVGRPAVPGASVTFRFAPQFFEMITKGAEIQARQRSVTHPKGHRFAPSYGHWLRSLIDYGYPRTAKIPAETLRQAMADVSTYPPEDMVKLSMTLMEEQRIKLRKFECECQALDWAIDLQRNSAINLMVKLHGDDFNALLSSSQNCA